ncbi:beta-1,3-n-acetylglucosaminyltransferase [Plakobranchus ocellatus]|uniref:Beta-1,3-n-acetylglucosaminyltransferase n=1 Tax=Plakobranchus ocellatus TaxID=259542 RepID=A0AAV4CNB6_9GAST|nr:beta-1,3-n-acetylglucosaminyltransferase [Plakobranchus ocellatus]
MRLSLRKVVKFTTFLVALLLLNIWVSYNVNFWSFNNFEDRGKVLRDSSARGRDGDNGGAVPLETDRDRVGQEQDAAWNGVKSQRSFSNFAVSGNQRSAKAFSGPGTKDYFDIVQEAGLQNRPAAVKPFDNGSNLLLRSSVPNAMRNENADARIRSRPLSQPKSDTQTALKDIFISVKTTAKYHASRIRLIQKTWYALARDETYFFTDGNDKELGRDLGGHLINTNCSTGHSRRALSCKMAVEMDFYMASRKRWFCHLDDDVYLNVPRLLELLQKYNHKQDWYLGKPSLKHPLEVIDRDNPGMKLTFWFATGGAGFCISRSLALKMAPYASGGRFMTTAEQIRLPDDCTIGYIIEHLLKQRLTIINLFHSHLEALWLIKRHQLEKQVTFSYSKYSGKLNVLNVDGFDVEEDPTRLKSVHCLLFPTFRECETLPRHDE